ncbi:hypothetical protein P692DRAFT_20750172 [Suillus brevipes Sb2]|nr:hypothetical protein P692DRAFT_20750172 [Suillus brevipes Sb2]
MRLDHRLANPAAGISAYRIGITPETDAEADAAMQRINSNQPDNSTQPGQPAAEAQASQVQPIQTQAQVSTVGLEDIACGVSCCGTFIGFRRSASHRSARARARSLSSSLLS